MKRRTARILALLIAALLAAVLVAAAVPPVRARAKALPVLLRAIGVPFPRPLAARVAIRDVRLAPYLDGDLYWPGDPAPVIVLVTGSDPLGKNDPRIIRVARSIAGARRVVFVPQLDLRNSTFRWLDVQRIVTAVRTLRATFRPESVGLLGFSDGGSFSLLAAEQPGIGPLAFVATFGAYYDLVDVIQGVTTGATTDQGKVVPWKTVPEARQILTTVAVQLSAPQDRGRLTQALASRDPSGLSPGGRVMYDLLENTDPLRTASLAARLSPDVRITVARFSPASNIGRLRTPLFIMHSENDPAAPLTEAAKLHRTVAGSRLIVLHYYLHVSPPGQGTPIGGYVADGWGGLEFTSWVLGAQE